MAENKKNGSMVWLDCEMTGLDVAKDHIIEVAIIITNDDLEIVCEPFEVIIHKEKEIMENMNEWCIIQHGKTKLTEKVAESEISTEMAEKTGNSVHCDLGFLKVQMPKVVELLHYRIIGN
ncbi:putative oligoribonuclease [Smittium culicis]|uniref:Putative oligoribonuclease n=1 Tax=Smittium culicis TaxID=133412 RepID=A0A1R1Y5I7_9FUNG|nr:putative oligoribonuclease [Smittium culicis]